MHDRFDGLDRFANVVMKLNNSIFVYGLRDSCYQLTQAKVLLPLYFTQVGFQDRRNLIESKDDRFLDAIKNCLHALSITTRDPLSDVIFNFVYQTWIIIFN